MSATSCDHAHRRVVTTIEAEATLSGVEVCEDCGSLILPFNGPPVAEFSPLTRAQIDRLVEAMPRSADGASVQVGAVWLMVQDVLPALYRAAGIEEVG